MVSKVCAGRIVETYVVAVFVAFMYNNFFKSLSYVCLSITVFTFPSLLHM